MWGRWSAWDWLASVSRAQNRITLSETCCPAPVMEESRPWQESWKGLCQLPSHMFQLARLLLVPCSGSWQSTGLGPCDRASLHHHSFWQNIKGHATVKVPWYIIYSCRITLGMLSCSLGNANTPNYLTIMTSYRRSRLYFILTSLSLKQICLGLSSPQFDANRT